MVNVHTKDKESHYNTTRCDAKDGKLAKKKELKKVSGKGTELTGDSHSKSLVIPAGTRSNIKSRIFLLSGRLTDFQREKSMFYHLLDIKFCFMILCFPQAFVNIMSMEVYSIENIPH